MSEKDNKNHVDEYGLTQEQNEAEKERLSNNITYTAIYSDGTSQDFALDND